MHMWMRRTWWVQYPDSFKPLWEHSQTLPFVWAPQNNLQDKDSSAISFFWDGTQEAPIRALSKQASQKAKVADKGQSSSHSGALDCILLWKCGNLCRKCTYGCPLYPVGYKRCSQDWIPWHFDFFSEWTGFILEASECLQEKNCRCWLLKTPPHKVVRAVDMGRVP